MIEELENQEDELLDVTGVPKYKRTVRYDARINFMTESSLKDAYEALATAQRLDASWLYRTVLTKALPMLIANLSKEDRTAYEEVRKTRNMSGAVLANLEELTEQLRETDAIKPPPIEVTLTEEPIEPPVANTQPDEEERSVDYDENRTDELG